MCMRGWNFCHGRDELLQGSPSLPVAVQRAAAIDEEYAGMQEALAAAMSAFPAEVSTRTPLPSPILTTHSPPVSPYVGSPGVMRFEGVVLASHRCSM